jgi:3-oxoadipate enol-lactonase
MKTAIAGTEISYEKEGTGPAVLFLHAFPLSMVMWDAQMAAFERTHTVVRFDDRGFGGSARGTGPLTMERVADDAAALLDHLGISTAVVVGCSMGGYAALAFVRRHLIRLSGLVLVDTRSGADTEEARKNRALLAARVLAEGPAAVAEAFLPKLVGETSRKQRPALVESVREIILGNSPGGIADALMGLAARADSGPTLKQIQVPTLVLCGAEDVLTPPSDSEALARGIASSRLEIIPRAGHLANLENPEEFNAVLKDFLAG